MNEAGVLGRFIPGIRPCRGADAVQHVPPLHGGRASDPRRGNVAAIERGDHKDTNPLTSDIVKRIQSRNVLYCAILLHDVAKGLPGDHSDVGRRIARSLCPRLGLSAADTAAVAWLVKNHLVMSDTAQRRDVGTQDGARFRRDGAVAGDAAPAGDPDRRRYPRRGPGRVERLEGPAAARALLCRGKHDDRRRPGAVAVQPGAAAKAALEARLPISPPSCAKGAERHYDNYWLAFDEDELERHARLITKADADNKLLTLDAIHQQIPRRHRDHSLHPDNAGLFSQFAGAIAMSGGSIVDAKAFTTCDGFALDVFSVQDSEGEAFGDAERLARLRQTIEKTLRGELRPRRELARRVTRNRASAFNIKPKILFDNEASRIATVIEVECLDRPGLLYDITQAIFEAGLSISTSMVATYGERAIDVFLCARRLRP
jgi:[protein-PII] uridylyltransferase